MQEVAECEQFPDLPVRSSGKEVRIMGAAFLVGSVLIAMAAAKTVTGFIVYGMSLGLCRLFCLCSRLAQQVAGDEE